MILSSKPGLYEMSMPDDDQHTLKLFKVRSDDMGEMTFVASNKYGNDSCAFNVEMAGRQSIIHPIHWTHPFACSPHKPLIPSLSAAAPTFETIMEDLDVCAGESPRFAVVVEGKPVPDILWFKVVVAFLVFQTFTVKNRIIFKIV